MKKLYGKYGLPLKIEYCKKCTRSNQRPVSAQEFRQKAADNKAIVPLDSGICNACHYAEIKKTMNGDKAKDNADTLKAVIKSMESKRKNTTQLVMKDSHLYGLYKRLRGEIMR